MNEQINNKKKHEQMTTYISSFQECERKHKQQYPCTEDKRYILLKLSLPFDLTRCKSIAINQSFLAPFKDTFVHVSIYNTQTTQFRVMGFLDHSHLQTLNPLLQQVDVPTHWFTLIPPVLRNVESVVVAKDTFSAINSSKRTREDAFSSTYQSLEKQQTNDRCAKEEMKEVKEVKERKENKQRKERDEKEEKTEIEPEEQLDLKRFRHTPRSGKDEKVEMDESDDIPLVFQNKAQLDQFTAETRKRNQYQMNLNNSPNPFVYFQIYEHPEQLPVPPQKTLSDFMFVVRLVQQRLLWLSRVHREHSRFKWTPAHFEKCQVFHSQQILHDSWSFYATRCLFIALPRENPQLTRTNRSWIHEWIDAECQLLELRLQKHLCHDLSVLYGNHTRLISDSQTVPVSASEWAKTKFPNERMDRQTQWLEFRYSFHESIPMEVEQHAFQDTEGMMTTTTTTTQPVLYWLPAFRFHALIVERFRRRWNASQIQHNSRNELGLDLIQCCASRLKMFQSVWRPRYDIQSQSDRKHVLLRYCPHVPARATENGILITFPSALDILDEFNSNAWQEEEEDVNELPSELDNRPVIQSQKRTGPKYDKDEKEMKESKDVKDPKETKDANASKDSKENKMDINVGVNRRIKPEAKDVSWIIQHIPLQTSPSSRIQLIYDCSMHIRHKHLTAFLQECNRRDPSRFNYAAYGGVPSPGKFWVPEDDFFYLMYLSLKVPDRSNVLSQIRSKTTPFYVDFDLTLSRENGFVDILQPCNGTEHSILSAMQRTILPWFPHSRLDMLVLSACGFLPNGKCRSSYRIIWLSTPSTPEQQQALLKGMVRSMRQYFGDTLHGVAWDMILDPESHKDGAGSRAFLQESQKWIRCAHCKETGRQKGTRCPTGACKLQRNGRPQREFCLYLDRVKSPFSSYSSQVEQKRAFPEWRQVREQIATQDLHIQHTRLVERYTEQWQHDRMKTWDAVDGEIQADDMKHSEYKLSLAPDPLPKPPKSNPQTFLERLRESQPQTDRYPFRNAQVFRNALESKVSFKHFVWLSTIRRPDGIPLAPFVDQTPRAQRGGGHGNHGIGSGKMAEGGDGRGNWQAVPKQDTRRELMTHLLIPYLGPNVSLAQVQERKRDDLEPQFKGLCHPQSSWCVHQSRPGTPYVHKQNRSTFFITRSHAYLNDFKCSGQFNRDSVAFTFPPTEAVTIHSLFGDCLITYKARGPSSHELAQLYDDRVDLPLSFG